MARTKEFERDDVLRRAREVFAEHGYAGASMQMLLKSMDLSRQSLYDTFGDKKRLYIAALSQYADDNVGEIVTVLLNTDSPRNALQQALTRFIARPTAQGCLGIHAICEFGTHDAEVNMITAAAGARLLRVIEGTLLRGQERGEFTREQTAHQLAEYLAVLLNGLRLASRSGADHEKLQVMVEIAMRSLR